VRLPRVPEIAVGPILTLLTIAALVFVVIRADANSEAEKRYLLCVVNRALLGQPQPEPGAPCVPPKPLAQRPTGSTSAQVTAFASALAAENECRIRRALDGLPPVPAGESCVPAATAEPATPTTEAPSPTTTTTTPPPPSRAAPPPERGTTQAAAARPALVPVVSALLPALPVDPAFLVASTIGADIPVVTVPEVTVP
jgi:hypothetical protein